MNCGSIEARPKQSKPRGRVVAIPTDALYTVVADPFNLRAVSRVFAFKGRDFHRSLPLLISDSLMAEDLSRQLSTRFFLLARRFWPGPLRRCRCG
jgi:L-threonylcarbamoyladenylate synthase